MMTTPRTTSLNNLLAILELKQGDGLACLQPNENVVC
jgi:hypothetical protein